MKIHKEGSGSYHFTVNVRIWPQFTPLISDILVCLNLTITLAIGSIWYHYFLLQICISILDAPFFTAINCFWMVKFYSRPLMGSSTTTTMDHTQFAASRLPKLTLPVFSGNPLTWLTFWQAAIHLNLNPWSLTIWRLNFKEMQQELLTESLSVIVHAVTLVRARFGQTYKLIAAHMQALWEVPNPKKALVSLRTFHSTIESHFRGLFSLGISE